MVVSLVDTEKGQPSPHSGGGTAGRHHPGAARAASQEGAESRNFAHHATREWTHWSPGVPCEEERSVHFLIHKWSSHPHLAGSHEEQVVTFGTTHSVGHPEGHKRLAERIGEHGPIQHRLVPPPKLHKFLVSNNCFPCLTLQLSSFGL